MATLEELQARLAALRGGEGGAPGDAPPADDPTAALRLRRAALQGGEGGAPEGAPLPAPEDSPQPRTTLLPQGTPGNIARGAGLAAVPALGALAGGSVGGPWGAAAGALALPIADAAVWANKKLSGLPYSPFKNNIPSPSAALTRALDKYVAPPPTDTTGRLVEAAVSGVGVPTRAATVIPQLVAGPVGGAAAEATAQALENYDLPAWLKSGASIVAGTGAGTATPAAARRAVTPNPALATRQNPEEARIVAAAADFGIDLPLAAKTGNPALRGVEVPGGERRQREQFTTAAANMAGIAGDNVFLSPEVLHAHLDGLRARLNAAEAQVPLIDPAPLGVTVPLVIERYTRGLEIGVRTIFNDYATELMGFVASGAQITPGQYTKLHSEIARITRDNSDRGLKAAMGDLQHALDDAAMAQMPPDLAAEFRETRALYARTAVLTDAITRGSSGDKVAGFLSPTAFDTKVLGKDSQTYATGGLNTHSQGIMDYNTLARVGLMLEANPYVPRTTAARLPWWATSLLGAGGAGAINLATGNPLPVYAVPAIGAAAATVLDAVPAAVRRIGATPAGQAYRGNQLLPRQGWNAAMPDALAAAIVAARNQKLPQ